MPGYREIAPSARVRPFVDCFWAWETGGEPSPHRVLPDGCIDFLFSIRSSPEGEELDLRVIGPMTRYLDVSRANLRLVVGLRFRPAGALPFLEAPASELVDRRPSLEELTGAEGLALRERLAGARTVSERARVLETHLVERLERGGRRDELVEQVVRQMYEAGGALSVSSLVADTGLGARQLRRRFESAVGLTPKSLLRIVRLQKVLRTARQRPKVDWARLAVEAASMIKRISSTTFATGREGARPPTSRHRHPLVRPVDGRGLWREQMKPSTTERFIRLLTLLAAIGLLGGCAARKPPALQVAGLKFSGVGLSGAGLDVSFKIRNPNPEPVQIERFEYELKLNGRRIGRGYYPSALDLAGFADGSVTSRFDLNFLSLPGAIKEIFQQDRVKAQVAGDFYVKEPSGLKKLKFKNDGEIKLER